MVWMTTACAPFICWGQLARYFTYSSSVVTLNSSGTHQAEMTLDHMSTRLLSSFGFTVKLTWSPVVLGGYERHQ